MTNIENINNEWLMILVAAIKDGRGCMMSPGLNTKRREIALPYRQARRARGLKKISIFDDFESNATVDSSGRRALVPLPLRFFEDMSNDETMVWYAVGAEIADFSCLGGGVRAYIDGLWLGAESELKRRNLKRIFWCDLTADDFDVSPEIKPSELKPKLIQPIPVKSIAEKPAVEPVARINSFVRNPGDHYCMQGDLHTERCECQCNSCTSHTKESTAHEFQQKLQHHQQIDNLLYSEESYYQIRLEQEILNKDRKVNKNIVSVPLVRSNKSSVNGFIIGLLKRYVGLL